MYTYLVRVETVWVLVINSNFKEYRVSEILHISQIKIDLVRVQKNQ